jgi:hypothetical protein
MNMLALLASSASIMISNVFAGANITNGSIKMGSANLSTWGEYNTFGSHEEQCNKSFAMSAHNSENRQKWFGHGDPPNVNRKLGTA